MFCHSIQINNKTISCLLYQFVESSSFLGYTTLYKFKYKGGTRTHSGGELINALVHWAVVVNLSMYSYIGQWW